MFVAGSCIVFCCCSCYYLDKNELKSLQTPDLARSSIYRCVLFDWYKSSMQSLVTGFCRNLDTGWHVHVVCSRSHLSIWSLVPQWLPSFPGASPTFLSFFWMESWAGPRDKATVLSCEATSAAARAPRLALYFVLGLCSFCYAVSATRHTLSRSILHFLVFGRVFRGSLQQHDDSILKTPAALLRDHNDSIPTTP